MAGDTTPPKVEPAEATGRPGILARLGSRLVQAGLDRRFAATAIAPLVAAAATLFVVTPTLAPGVLSQAAGDTAEFQTVAWVMGTAHPTGYPSFIILGFIVSHLIPFGEPAFRMNLLQAFLAAGAVAGMVAVVQVLTGMRWIALAAGLLLLTMPTFVPAAVSFPSGMSLTTTSVVWRLATYTDPHMFHLALTALIFLLLLVWERRRNGDPERRSHADRWLVAAAGVYGVALANHSLTLMLAPGIALFVLVVAPRIVLQWRLIVTSAVVLAGTAIAFWLELPIRAAMNAPLVYAHPDTWNGFLYVITGQQFGGIPPSITHDIGIKYAAVMNLMSSWLGPLGFIAVLGLGTSLVRRPSYVLLSVTAAAFSAGFAAAYVNSDLERYFLVPVFVAFTYVGLGLADAASIGIWALDEVDARLTRRRESTSASAATAGLSTWPAQALPAVEAILAISLIAAGITVVPTRLQVVDGGQPGAVSQSDQTYRESWLRAVFAAPDKGGLPANSVIVSNWSDSTTLWYGQKVDGLRPDVYVIDDSMRVPAGDNLGQVWDVIDSYLGQRPVFLLRLRWNCDGMDNLSKFYQMTAFPLPDGFTITEVTAREGAVVCG